jgi:tetratricopeptide (TPR) repeat protein
MSAREEAVMLQLKPVTREGVPRALEKAERYRLLNEPVEAESICLDVLAVDPGNQMALATLLLALTDQFEERSADTVQRARAVLPRFRGDYERAYYAGIVCERRAKAHLKHGSPGAASLAYAQFQEAMGWFEKAEAIRPAGNDDAVLRWNTCARILDHRGLGPAPPDDSEPPLE